ncbi:dicarboxylate/amino acid:cation symporter [Lacrimispora indolis]|uniref:dicarboxylate/amino acid:cation symporter n=1 Tax=Lacrimispora indolis TaxID=69825 RepID=UPI00045EB0DE|nr:dicarboxylate/amino acid:cation symporter [Lacrimispora indolis]MBE7721884.1 dicarboxylate/amino acid:cation symporter [Lacrimispora celerecrescens]
MNKSDIWKSYRFPILLVLGILIGSVFGLVAGEKATIVKPLGDIFLNLMFTIVVPMVLVSISSAVGSMVNMKRLGSILVNLIIVFIGTGAVAAVLVLFAVNIFPPAANTTIAMSAADVGEAASAGDMIVGALTVSDFPDLLSRQNMLPLIIFSVMFGFCVSACGGDESPVGKMLINLNDIIMKMVNLIMKFAPIGLGAYFANLVGEFGPSLIGDYGRSMILYYPLCLVYVVIFFPLYSYIAGGKEGIRRMLKFVPTPAVTAFATQSSMATLPVNLDACDKMGVPKDIREIVLPMGATMHMDGSVLSAIVKIAFLYGVFNQPFTGVGTYAMSIVVAILSAFVLSGAPGGGLVGEMLIVGLFGFPPEAFPLIATLGFLFDPAATCLNSSGDAIASMMVARMVEGKKWINNHLTGSSEELVENPDVTA